MGNQFVMPVPPYAFPPPHPSNMPSESRKTSIDSSAIDKEPTTSSSIPKSQFSPHFTQIELDKDLKMGNEVGVDDAKRTTWSMDEDKVLARSWVTIRTNLVTGNVQKDQTFWKRIANYYNEHRPNGTVKRQWKKVKSHFYLFQPMVNEFSGIYNNLYSLRPSSWTDEDVLVRAHELWKESHKSKPFKYEHVWRILEECEKHTSQSIGHRIGKKTKTSESGVHTSSSNLDTSVDVDDCEARTRRIEENTAKRKGKSKITDINKVHEDIDSRWQMIKEYDIQMEMLGQKAKMEMRNIGAFQKDYEILNKDTSEMTSEQLCTHLNMCEIIKKRHEEYHMQMEMLAQKEKMEMRKAESFRKDYEILMRDISGMTSEQLHIHLHVCKIIKKMHGIS